MAPAPPLVQIGSRSSSQSIPELAGLSESSLELDAPLSKREVPSSTLSPFEAHKVLTARDGTSTFIHGSGTKPASSFNNAFFLALFAIIGAAMVVASLWFFFWAKNGGFHFRQGDWDDYKSTVLRRKGPDGKTLSNATKSTKLGYGASTIAGTQHYKWQKQAAQSVVGRDEKGRKGIRAKRGWAKTHSVLYSDDYMTETFGTQTVSDMTEIRTQPDLEAGNHHSKRYRDRDVQEYKREHPARVGGLNRVADGSHFGTTINGSETMSESSEQPLVNKKQRNPEKKKERAERKAKEEAARMERWKREAEEAAAALARENACPPPPPAHTSTTKKSTTPASKPAATKQRRDSRSASPRKRDFSYQSGPASEVLSTAYTASTGVTGSSGQRTSSYYEAYRPQATENPRYSSDAGGRTRQSSPTKKKPAAGRKGRDGGYRRGADSDLD